MFNFEFPFGFAAHGTTGKEMFRGQEGKLLSRTKFLYRPEILLSRFPPSSFKDIAVSLETIIRKEICSLVFNQIFYVFILHIFVHTE